MVLELRIYYRLNDVSKEEVEDDKNKEKKDPNPACKNRRKCNLQGPTGVTKTLYSEELLGSIKPVAQHWPKLRGLILSSSFQKQ